MLLWHHTCLDSNRAWNSIFSHAGDMASVVTELEGYIRETQASGGQQVTALKQVLDAF